MSEVPTLRGELDRKVGETLDWLITSYDIGKLDAVQFDVGISTLFMAVAGIADKDFINIITEAQGDGVALSHHIVSFHHPQNAVIKQIKWSVGDDAVIVVDRICGAKTSEKVIVCEDAKAAKAKVVAFGEVMTRKGWIEL
jgi:hypothetical protein